MNWSKYQKDIFKHVAYSDKNLLVNAVAGSGKSTTIIESLNYVPSSKRTIFLAFNKSIVEELKTKVPPHIHVSTLHSFGLTALRNKYKGQLKIDQRKVINYLFQVSSRWEECDEMDKKKQFIYLRTIQETISLMKSNMISNLEGLIDMVEKYGIVLSDIQLQRVLESFTQLNKRISVVDFDDMVYFPASMPDIIIPKYDVVYLDEQQDNSIAQQLLFKKAIKNNGRFVAVGDPHQCQPEGTKILTSSGVEKNIEDISIGDSIVGYNTKSKSTIIGYYSSKWSYKNYAPKVINKSERLDNVKLYTIKAGTHISQYTHNHKCIAKFNEKCNNAFVLYLMQKGDKFRIGIYPVYASSSNFGITQRSKSETADKCWLLNIYDDRQSALNDEQVYSYSFGIPQLRFKENTNHNNQKHINYSWNEILNHCNLYNRAVSLLNYFNKDIEYPIWIKNGKNYLSRYNFTEFQACNLFEKYMDFAIFDEKNKDSKGRFKLKPSTISNILIESCVKKVYSLEVSNGGCYVADKILTHNSIYYFRGTDGDSYQKMKSPENTIELPLSVSYRCGKKIVEHAKRLVPHIEAFKDNEDGKVIYNASVSDIKDGDMVLCRNKKPLIELCLNFIYQNKKAYMLGKNDIANQLINTIENTKKYYENDIRQSLTKQLKDIAKRKSEEYGITEKQAMVTMSYQTAFDRIQCVRVVFDQQDVTNAKQAVEKIEQIFDDSKHGIILSTIHKSKGLEADNVFVLRRDLLPSQYAKTPEEIQQETNLEYVMITRAKKKLAYIDWEPEEKLEETESVKDLDITFA